MLRETGFTEVELVCETGFNSSPVTRGALFKAEKPAHPNVEQVTT